MMIYEDEALVNKVYEKLDSEKERANEAYMKAVDIIKKSEVCVKHSEKNKKTASKVLKNFEKEFTKYLQFVRMLDPDFEFEIPAGNASMMPIPDLVIPKYTRNNSESVMMVTSGKYKYNDKKRYITLSFASGYEVTCPYYDCIDCDGSEY